MAAENSIKSDACVMLSTSVLAEEAGKNLEADGEIVFAIQCHWLCEVGATKLMRSDTKVIC
jgi:hypothetical protein